LKNLLTPSQVDGCYIPPNIKVGVNQHAASMSAKNFSQPHDFIPETWQKDMTQFDRDQQHIHQPLSMGSRGCLGKK
jgi:cytochrome P450